MKSPFDAIEDRLEEVVGKVERRVWIKMLREDAKIALSRLATLDTDRSAAYLAAIEAMQ